MVCHAVIAEFAITAPEVTFATVAMVSRMITAIQTQMNVQYLAVRMGGPVEINQGTPSVSAIADRESLGVTVNKTYRNVALVLLPARGMQHVQIH